MKEELTIETERVDDVPVLLAQLDKMPVARLLDEHFPRHGNWQGLSVGITSVVWLSHILSQANHRLNHVQPWLLGFPPDLFSRVAVNSSELALQMSEP